MQLRCRWGSFVIEEVLEVDWFMTKILMVEALIILVPVVVMVLRFNVAHFFSCFVNIVISSESRSTSLCAPPIVGGSLDRALGLVVLG
jgi:hypothetical protein